MTISNDVNKVVYRGNGTTDTYPYPFRVFKDTDLIVTRVTVNDPEEEVLVLNTDYTVTVMQ
ncbi:MAG: hypothetical protein ACOYJW_04710 [Candidatus Omnitrophota bacterium]|jgi:hypothetical protein